MMSKNNAYPVVSSQSKQFNVKGIRTYFQCFSMGEKTPKFSMKIEKIEIRRDFGRLQPTHVW